MGLGVSLFLIAVGAVLAFAVDATVNGLDIVTVGWILMLVGGFGAVPSLLFWSSRGGFAGTRSRTTYVERDRELLERTRPRSDSPLKVQRWRNTNRPSRVPIHARI